MSCVSISVLQKSTANRRSIVAIHGLGGDAEHTWEHGTKLWLRDFLPSQVPAARVMSYGYDSTVAFSTAVSGINDFALGLINGILLERNTRQV